MGLENLTLEEAVDELERLALAATKGPWKHRTAPGYDDNGFVEAPKADPSHPYNIQVLGEDKNERLYPPVQYQADCDYIAAADPPTILRIIESWRSR